MLLRRLGVPAFSAKADAVRGADGQPAAALFRPGARPLGKAEQNLTVRPHS